MKETFKTRDTVVIGVTEMEWQKRLQYILRPQILNRPITRDTQISLRKVIKICQHFTMKQG